MYAEDGDGNIYNDNSSTEADGQTNHKTGTVKIFPSTSDCLVPLTTVSRRGIPESCLSNKLSRWVKCFLSLMPMVRLTVIVIVIVADVIDADGQVDARHL